MLNTLGRLPERKRCAQWMGQSQIVVGHFHVFYQKNPDIVIIYNQH